MASVRIRNALVSDTEAICRVHKSSIRALCAGVYSPEEIEAWIGPRVPKDYEQFLREAVFLVAEADEVVAAFAILNPTTGELHALYVHPGHFGEGIGTELLRAVETEARVCRLSVIALNATLNSVSFYEKHGYSSRGAAMNELPGGTELPCVRVEKALL
jgi:putative acetyltransferase